MRKLDNYKVIFWLKILKNALTTFVESFFVLYFLTLSDNNILPLGIYKLVFASTMFITFFLLRNICKTKYRINLLRIGIFLDLIYFLTIILLKENIVNYIYIVGILYGLNEGFYYSIYNIFESDGVSNKRRTKFAGNYTTFKAAFTIMFSIIYGSLIAKIGFLKSILVVISIVVIRIALSFAYKDTNIPTNKKTDLKKYISKIKNEKIIKQVYNIYFFSGLTYSKGAFQSIVTIYIIKVFSDSFSLGIFTSIFSLISFIIGLLFAKKINKKNYSNIIKVAMTITIISLCIMILKCNMITIILFNFFQTFSKELVDLINNNSLANVSNLKLIKDEYKTEYYLGFEFSLFLGRIISQSIFILMAFTGVVYIIPLFVIFLIMLMINSIKLQTYVNKQ